MESKNIGTPEEYSKLLTQLADLAEIEVAGVDNVIQEGRLSNEMFHNVVGINGMIIAIAFLYKRRALFQITEAASGSEAKETAANLASRSKALLSRITESKGVKGTRLELFIKRYLESTESALQWLTSGLLSLRLSDVQIDPPIPDERVFTGTEITDIEREAGEYVRATYPGRYINDFTLNRLLVEAMRDESGKTNAERAKEVFNVSDFWSTEEGKEKEQKHDEINKAYALKLDDVDKWRVEERARIVASFKERRDVAPLYSDEYQSVEDEMTKALDTVDAEALKRTQDLHAAKNREIDTIWVPTNSPESKQ